MDFNFDSSLPLFIQLADKLRLEIAKGTFGEDGQIPTVRTLSLEAGVNPNTVQRALSLLESEGLLYTKRTLGNFISNDAKDRARDTTLRSLCERIAQLGVSEEELLNAYRDTLNNK